MIGGRIAHLVAITFEATITPTFTTAPTVAGLNNVVRQVELYDGSYSRFNGAGFNAIRNKEIYETGLLIHPDPDTNSGSTNGFYLERTLTLGPPKFQGAPSDFAVPTGMLSNGEVRYTFGALVDISADATALTATIIPVAWLLLLDEVRIPPAYEWVEYGFSGTDNSISGRGLYCFAGLLNSNSYDAISAGDFGAITVDGVGYVAVPSIDAEVLGRAYRAQMFAGQFSPVQGEPRASTDDNGKAVNSGTPTALVAPTAAIQPVLWSPEDARITKIPALAESALRVRFNGTQTTNTILFVGRILEQTPTVVASNAAKALGALGLKHRGTKIKTLSKQPYTGPRPEFMPYAIKVAA
jgi:hypothetical protein